jgi:hypothetical protein
MTVLRNRTKVMRALARSWPDFRVGGCAFPYRWQAEILDRLPLPGKKRNRLARTKSTAGLPTGTCMRLQATVAPGGRRKR